MSNLSIPERLNLAACCALLVGGALAFAGFLSLAVPAILMAGAMAIGAGFAIAIEG